MQKTIITHAEEACKFDVYLSNVFNHANQLVDNEKTNGLNDTTLGNVFEENQNSNNTWFPVGSLSSTVSFNAFRATFPLHRKYTIGTFILEIKCILLHKLH